MKQNDYNNYDTLQLYVKKCKMDEIISRYKIFGWDVIESSDNAQYEDIVDITLLRPHKIDSKDELQLMQVYMEERLNAIAKIERNKHAKTTAIGLCLGVAALAVIIISILNLCRLLLDYNIVISIIMLSIGIIGLIIEVIMLPRLYKKENAQCLVKKHILERELDIICNNVKNLSGGHHDESNT